MSVITDKVFHQNCKRYGIPEPVCEYQFHKTRRWRFDYAWLAQKVALEVEGGIFGFTDPKTGHRRTGGAHGSITGIKRDIEKYNHAAAMGWLVICCLPTTLAHDETVAYVRAAINTRRPKETEPEKRTP